MKIKNKKKILNGIIIDGYEAVAQVDDKSFPIQYFKHPGAVCIAASLDNEYFFLVEQFRFGTETQLLEFPAGKIDDPSEDPIVAAHRELSEEIGYQANEMIPLGIIHPAAAYIDEVIHLYYAKDLSYVGQNLDETESIQIKTFTLQEIEEMIYCDDITDAKTIVLYMKLKNYLSK